MSETDFKYYKEDIFDIGLPLHIFITNLLDEDRLRKTWMEYRSYIACKYQTSIESEFEKWNFYIFYQVEDKSQIDVDLLHDIESNTVSSRKILISHSKVKDGNLFDYVKEKYIMSSNLSKRNYKSPTIEHFVKANGIDKILEEF